MGLTVMWFWLFLRSVSQFCAKKLSILLLLADCATFSIRFKVFVENTSSFGDLVLQVFFRIWVPVSHLSGNYVPQVMSRTWHSAQML